MPTNDSDLAIAAAEAGAAIVRSMYRTPVERLAKSPTDFATTADLEAEKAILKVLRFARPNDAVDAEESGATGPADTDRRWLVDPICGTLNFAAETPLAAVNVALRAGGDIVAAASADPVAGEIFWTDGAKTWLRHHDSDTLATPSAQSHIVDVNLDPPFPNGFRAARLLGVAQFAEWFRPRVVSTTLAVAWVAAGRRAAYVTDGDMRENVHFASGLALCRAAGCVVSGLRGEPVGSGATGLVAAADKTVHARLLGLVARCHEDREP